MYLTDYQYINNINDIDIKKLKGFKAIGFLALANESWKTPIGMRKFRRIQQYFVHNDDIYFFICDKLEVRDGFKEILNEYNDQIRISDGKDFIAYYRAEKVSLASIEISVEELSNDLDIAISEIDAMLKNLQKEMFWVIIRKQALEKSGGIFFEIIKKLISGGMA